MLSSFMGHLLWERPMLEWYFVSNNERKGPVSENEISRLILDGEIKPATLVWRKEMREWTAASSVDELSGLFASLPPPLPIVESVNSDDNDADVKVILTETPPRLAGAWQRFLARMIDVIIFTFTISFITAYSLQKISPRLASDFVNLNPFILNWICLFLSVFLIALIMWAFGNTPGKALLRIKVVPAVNDWKYTSHFAREFKVWAQGLGLGLPIVFLITLIVQYRRVSSGKPTLYDEGVAHVEGLRPGIIRYIIAIIFVLLSYTGITIMNTAAEQKRQQWKRLYRQLYLTYTRKRKKSQLGPPALLPNNG